MNHHAAFTRIRRIDRPLRFANLGILLHTVLLPFPTEVMSRSLQENSTADARAAVGLYALVGALMCAAWLAFFHYLARRRDLVEEDVPERFFHDERERAWIGVGLYLGGGLLGILTTPYAALGVFVLLPIFYGVTSEGLTEFRATVAART
jgi:uncharacterized membrane protein